MKKIGFIGQGFIGKSYADDFEKRGFSVVRYAMEPEYLINKDKIKKCDVVFIAVPTPTTPKGFDSSIVKKVIKLVGKGKIAFIKSTILPGMTELLQKNNPDIFVFHSPEFLDEVTASYDAEHPKRNIIGIPISNKLYNKKAKDIIKILPKSPYSCICTSREAEIIKYGGNCLGYTKVLFMNLLYDFSQKFDCDWKVIRDSMSADPRIGNFHMDPVHKSGRGAGGHCFIKDFSAFTNIYEDKMNDPLGLSILKSLEKKNIELLKKSNKDIDLLRGVYGML
ncbi:MAG: hypothetical protein NUV47_02995 [Patescibacteria group bacterium]|nr:hypothetical protein [Patescibacteria group bacterium]